MPFYFLKKSEFNCTSNCIEIDEKKIQNHHKISISIILFQYSKIIVKFCCFPFQKVQYLNLLLKVFKLLKIIVKNIKAPKVL
jgi:hypothetical protein